MITERLILRARFKTQIRALLEERGLIEVDVPLLYPKVCTDRCVEPISLHFQGLKLYLQPSPELNLKKIVADHRIDCYSLNYAYRADPGTPLHHPEFLMLEFYLIGDRYLQIQALTTEIIQVLMGNRAVRTRTYQEAWFDVIGSPYTMEANAYREILKQRSIDFNPSWDRAFLEDLVFGSLIQPTLGIDCVDIIDGFPLHQAALARIVGPDRAARYEVFVEGMEVANGYNELSGGAANEQRFTQWQEQREHDGLDRCEPLDYSFFSAMDRLPECSGVALGLDRILMLALKCIHLKDSIPFYWI